MWLVSSRYTLDSDNKPSTVARVYEAPDRRAPSSKIRPANWVELLDAVKNSRVLLLVHGYDNAIEDVTKSYGTVCDYVAANVKGHYDHVIGYTWPSSRNKARWWLAKRNASKVDGMFYDLCKRLGGAGVCIDVMTHSLGAHVVLEALTDNAAKRGLVRNLFLTAAAVDNESVQKMERYYRATRVCEHVYNFHSRADDVLELAYTIAEADIALGWIGPESPELLGSNFFIANCLRVVNGHSRYKDCQAVYDYIASALRRPASVPKLVTL